MDAETIKRLVKHLEGGEAFSPIKTFLDEITFDKLGERPHGLPYSFYEIFYHMRYAQHDILQFCVADDYQESKWPDDYWPEEQAPKTENEWKNLKNSFFRDRDDLVKFISDSPDKLMQPVKNGEDQTLLRELMLVVEHSAYHTGQLVIILRLLGLHKS
ncbi:DinB family protein [Leeuwenhoekiella sp. A16]|uniref:DinB family protein n=1 Tax=unclassified Leeuwenhoekiella TaxID=2615029 RepID=UPI003A8056D8|tara:strand:- start:2819 stop:3292 length:474 start_codon:yes stop_codon:yes gene_type:complete